MKKIKYTYIWTLLLIINTCLADNSNTGIFPSSFTASDYPWDHGDKIVLSWKLNDTIVNTIESYSIFIATGVLRHTSRCLISTIALVILSRDVL